MARNPNNKTGRHPVGAAVLCEPYEPEIKKSVIAIPETVKQRGAMVETRMRVIEIGPNCWPEEPPRCQIGDIVMVSKYCGVAVKGTDGKNYRLVNAEDIFCLCDPDVPMATEDFAAGAA